MGTILDLSPYLSTTPRKPKRNLPFKCDQCDYSARYQCQLRDHTKVHLDLKPLACSIPGCTYTTKWKHCLASHKAVHEDETTLWYKCEKCDFKTKYKYVLEKRHARLHSKGPITRRYKCDVCEYQTDDRPKFVEHRKNHNEDVKRIPCEYDGCEYTTRWKCSMFQHMKRYHSTEIVWYNCDQCKYQTQDKTYLRRHAISHSEERPFSCPYHDCDFKSKTATSLRSHQVRLDHFVTPDGQDRKNFVSSKKLHCTHSGCKFSSNDSGDLSKHLKIHDPHRKRNVKCPLCHKSFFDISGLKAHVNYHTFEKPFLCSFPNCNFKGIYLSDVRKHEWVHVTENMFPCTFKGCKAKFKMAGYLRKHLLCHDERRAKYTCNLCSLKFVTRGGLRNHISVHTNEKAYKCGDCGYSTAKSYEFKRHKCLLGGDDGNKMEASSELGRVVPVSQCIGQLSNGSFRCRRCPFTSISQHAVAVHSGWVHSEKSVQNIRLYRQRETSRR